MELKNLKNQQNTTFGFPRSILQSQIKYYKIYQDK